jgi:hypothetical protein
MSTIDEQDLIKKLTFRGQMTIASVAGFVVLLGVGFIVNDLSRRESPRVRGVIPGKAACANAGHPPAAAPAPAHHADILGWLAVAAAAASLALSGFLMRLWVTWYRRQIAAGTWASLFRKVVDESGEVADTLTEHPATQTDRGKLAFVFYVQQGIGTLLLLPASAFAAIVSMETKSPIALGAALLLACGLVAWFPTRNRIANWIDRQEETLIQERHAAI